MLFIFLFSLLYSYEIKNNDLEQIIAHNSYKYEVNIQNDYHYVFVAGFLNEALPNYFKDNFQYLRKNGADSVYIHYPNTNYSIKENINSLYDFLNNLTKDRKIVLMAHSRGAVESLFLQSIYQGWAKKRIQHMYLIQAAFGSPIADFSNGDADEIDSRLPFFSRISCWLSLKAKYFLQNYIQNGIDELSKEKMNDYIQKYLTPIQNKKDFYRNITVITSETIDAADSIILNCSSHYLNTYYSKNDGLVLLSNQKPKAIKAKHWHFIDYDHLAFMLAKPLSSNKKELRAAFTYMLLQDLEEGSYESKY